MSVTFQKVPQELQPTYNPVIIAGTGSYQTFPNYQMVIGIEARGESIANIKVPVNPDGYVLFDLHRHLENVVTYDFDPDWVGLNIATNSFATYSLSFAEQFRYEWEFYDNAFTFGGFLGFIGLTGAPAPLFNVGDSITVLQDPVPTNIEYNGNAQITGITQSGSNYIIITNKPFLQSSPPEGGKIWLSNFELTTVDSGRARETKFVWNGVFNFLDFRNYTENDFIPSGTTPSRWLTSVPQNWEMDLDDRMWLLAYKNDNNQQKDLIVQTNNGTYRITSPYSTGVGSNPGYRFISAAVGPWHLINATSSFTAIGTASFPMIDNNTKEYKVWYRNQILQVDTEVMTFKLKRKCSKYEKIQLVFLDKLGSFIPYTFNMVSRNMKEIEKSKYKQFYGEYPVAADAWNYQTYSRGTKTLDVRVKENWMINSDWVNQETSDFLMELFESPEVYWIKEDGVSLAIHIEVSNIERKQTINDQIINYELMFELAQKDMKQKG